MQITRRSALTAGATLFAAPALHAQAPTEITVQYAMPAVFGPVQEEIATAFMAANPGIRVTFRAPASNYEEGVQRVLREAMANQAPDVAYVGLNRIEILAERELAQDLAPFIGTAEQATAAGFTPSLRALGQARGKQYGLAFAASAPVIYANADLVRRGGGNPDAFPTDWDGVIALGAAIKRAAADSDDLYYHFFGSDWMWQAAIGSFGGRVLDNDGVPAFDDERGLMAGRLLKRFHAAGHPRYNRNEAQQSFAAGRLGLMIDSSAFLANVQRSVGDRFPLAVRAFPIANQADGWMPTGGAAAVMLTRDAAKQRAAWRYMEFATGAEGAARVVRGTGYLPTNQRAVDDPAFLGEFYAQNPNQASVRTAVSRLAPWYAFPGERGVRATSLIMRGLRDILDTGADADATVRRVAAEARRELGR